MHGMSDELKKYGGLKRMFEIIPSPGTENKDWSEIERKIETVKPFAKTIHIDIIDGKFANNTTFSDPEPFKKYTNDIFFEVHLMVEEPIQYIKPWAAAGFKRFIGQIEKMSDQAAFVAEAQEVGDAGLAVDGPNSLENVTVPHIDLDCILIMTIAAGFSGQSFQREQLEKVKKLAEQSSLIPVEVDGGINKETITDAFNAGARRFVATSAIFGNSDPAAAYKALHDQCEALLG
jgi:ribulose-phosphate 3-epimerase